MHSPLYRRVLLVVALAVGSFGARAQEAPGQFGKIKPQDFTVAKADTAQEAVIEFDQGRSRMEGGREGFQVTFVRTTRIRILRKAGYQWATVEVPLYRVGEKIERLRDVKGFTYNLVNGEVVKDKLAPDAIFKERTDEHHVRCRFTLPNVREGSIIEFSYIINSDFTFNLQGWQFQYPIPVRWSEYQTVIPGYFRYKQLTRGFLQPTLHEEKIVNYGTHLTWPSTGLMPPQEANISTQAVSERWVMQNVPAFKKEPFLTTAHDYISSIFFELNTVQYPNQKEQDVTGTWEQINESLNREETFGGRLKIGPLRQQAALLAAQYPDTLQRARAVMALVQRTVRHNDVNRIFTETTLHNAANVHQGGVAEVNLLLVQTLREAGLHASPVLLSTRDHGQILLDLPLLSQFNYVVAQVRLPGQPDALLDATAPVAPLGVLPERCLNGHGRLVADKPAEGRWVVLKPGQRFLQYTTAQLSVDERGALQGTVRFEHGGYAAQQAREELLAATPQTYVGRLQQQHPDWTISNTTFQHQQDLEQPLTLDLNLRIAGGEAPAATLYLPLLRQFTEAENPLRSEERFYPVSFGSAREQTAVVSLTLPAGYVVQELPAPLALTLPNGGGRFLFQATQTNPHSVQLTSRLQLLKAQ
ncbi:DUF3857 domain-containing protein [Hymenobacter persicinus]|uniref:DUF3857 domain-containing protein n=1 Tax=Hymenobacter persicinus TaxID=2025506 RepID=A0A4Q5L7U3_9BACT|nr:DUF3857 domain-containing protein [Hymenobacter persicinus]RYU77649.1 DUF3857 domain-containing protein [Hymenobacter persicinus]